MGNVRAAKTETTSTDNLQGRLPTALVGIGQQACAQGREKEEQHFLHKHCNWATGMWTDKSSELCTDGVSLAVMPCCRCISQRTHNASTDL